MIWIAFETVYFFNQHYDVGRGGSGTNFREHSICLICQHILDLLYCVIHIHDSSLIWGSSVYTRCLYKRQSAYLYLYFAAHPAAQPLPAQKLVDNDQRLQNQMLNLQLLCAAIVWEGGLMWTHSTSVYINWRAWIHNRERTFSSHFTCFMWSACTPRFVFCIQVSDYQVFSVAVSHRQSCR